jgi:putative salt-induced outer membrane protein YdiY
MLLLGGEVSLYKALLAPVLLLVSSQALLASQIVMQNGDRLSGTIEKSDDKKLVIKTTYAGEVTVDLGEIQSIDSDKPLHVSLQDGQKLIGLVKTTDGKMEVKPDNGSAVPVSKQAIKYIRSDEEEAAEHLLEHPTWKQGWAGGITTSFAMTRGNSETKNLGLAFTADRKTLHDHLGMYLTTVYATNDALGAIPSTTADSKQGGIRYDHDFGARTFGFGGADFQTDDLQDLDLRSVFSGGAGYHAIKTERTTLDFLGGLNYTRESYTTIQRNFMAVTLGEEFMKKLGESTVLTQKLYAYPDINDPGQYRATFNFGTLTKLNKWLGWQNTFADTYVTNPPLGARQNDIILTTGLNISFLK